MAVLHVMEQGWAEDTHLHELAQGFQVQRNALTGFFRHRREHRVARRGRDTISTFGIWHIGLPSCSRRAVVPTH